MKQVEITSKVVGRGESEGFTSAIPSINLSGFALKSDLLTLEKKFSDFLNVPIIDGTINRWNELETFLAGISEDYNLLSLLNGKADKSYVDTNFVTIAGTEDVMGLHNFVNGLKIGGVELVKKQDDVVYLDANLVVKGGITMYGDGEGGSSIPSYSTLGSLLNVDESNDAVASVDRVLFQSAGSNVWSWKALSEIGGGSSGGSVSGDYLPLSGGTLTGKVTIGLASAVPLVLQNTSATNSYIDFKANGWSTTKTGGVGIIREPYLGNEVTLLACGDPRILVSEKGGIYYQEGYNTETFPILHSGNYSSYALPKNGTAVSATKLQTARTIWGQSFDGTGNISGEATIEKIHLKSTYINLNRSGTDNTIYDTAKTALEVEATVDLSIIRTYNVEKQATIVLHKNGNIGIGDNAPAYKLEVGGTFRAAHEATFGKTITTGGGIYTPNGYLLYSKDSSGNIRPILEYNSNNQLLLGHDSAIISDTWICGKTITLKYSTSPYSKIGIHITESGYVGVNKDNPITQFDISGWAAATGYQFTSNGTGTFNKATITCNSTYGLEFEAAMQTDSYSGTHLPIFFGWRGGFLGMRLENGGNLLVAGGITMYSDQRKKTILNHVELSLKQIADAPLIEHYYNSDQNKTTHVGSIAQYWAGLNDWFCKLDNEGFYTMEIQNCALASAISIARHLEKYESKTDKKIRMLKKRIQELEDKLEKLEGGKYGCN